MVDTLAALVIALLAWLGKWLHGRQGALEEHNSVIASRLDLLAENQKNSKEWSALIHSETAALKDVVNSIPVHYVDKNLFYKAIETVNSSLSRIDSKLDTLIQTRIPRDG